jgi:gamma-glutamylcyclotransferase (GGCT)/AIG2-like uncharacterized protein YtfP
MRFNLFVYGTLKRGQSNHERFCRGLISVQEATVRGRLYELSVGFPALVVPDADVRATGTMKYLADAEADRYNEVEASEIRLPMLDDLEGFRPGEKSFYRRVLIPATLLETGATVPAWGYALRSASGLYLRGGRWPAI